MGGGLSIVGGGGLENPLETMPGNLNKIRKKDFIVLKNFVNEQACT